jgi:SOS-response transcriptional repressor LexA
MSKPEEGSSAAGLDGSEISEELFALRILGASMAPKFEEGDVVIIDPSIQPRLDDYVAAKIGGLGSCFRRYVQRQDERGEAVFGLAALAPELPAIWADGANISILGTMVEHRRFRHEHGGV